MLYLGGFFWRDFRPKNDRDELRQRLWPTDTFVDFDNGLNAARIDCGKRWEIRPKAVAELQIAARSDHRPFGFGALGYAYARAGIRNDALRLLREMKQGSQEGYFPAYEIALVYAGLGEKDRAFE